MSIGLVALALAYAGKRETSSSDKETATADPGGRDGGGVQVLPGDPERARG